MQVESLEQVAEKLDWSPQRPRRSLVTPKPSPDWQALWVSVNDRAAIYSETFPAQLASLVSRPLHSSPDDPWMIDQMQRLDTAYAAAYTLSTESVNKRVRCQ